MDFFLSIRAFRRAGVTRVIRPTLTSIEYILLFFHCLTVHFNSLNFTHQLMHFYEYI